MKSRVYFWVLMVFGAIHIHALGQESQPSLDTIEALRAQKNEEFDQLERACYMKFAVNDCIIQVNAQRRKMLAILKPQEEAIAAAERMQKAKEQLQRLEQKKQEALALSSEVSAIDPVASDNQKTQTQKEKVEKHQQRATENPPRLPAERTSNAPLPAELLKNEQAYKQKLEEANRRRAERDKRIAERDSKIKGLPQPGLK